MNPVIGISCYGERAAWGAWDTDAAVLHRAYVDALESAGAAVVLIPPHLNAEAIGTIIARLDGVVLAGGADIAADSYGHVPHSTADAPRRDRDATEFTLYEEARGLHLPVLGICRGMQVMAIASGGTLIQDLPSAGYGQSHRDQPGEFTLHRARFANDSKIARILGTQEMAVNSSHHQAVKTAGSLTITGWADDGTIEVLEDPSDHFVIGVQWHPEMTADRRLFTTLVQVAGR